jgi:hypothetical protein
MKKSLLGCVIVLLVGCSAQKAAEEPTSTAPPVTSPAPTVATKVPPPDEPKREKEPQVAEPEFKPGMTVAEAVNAVPADMPRLNIQQEALAAPISNPDLYAPCGLKPSEHFKLEVAIWDGKAVGVDIDLKPANPVHASCIREQVEKLAWREKAKSLNTVKFQF